MNTRQRPNQARSRLRVTGTNRYAEMVEKHFDVVGKLGDEWMAYCVFHENVNSPALQINVSTGDYICFSCHAKGGSVSLRRYCGERVGDERAYDLAEVRARLKMLTDRTGITDPQLRPRDESYLKRFAFPTNYWTERGFDRDVIEAFQLGYDPMENHATIPIRNWRGELLGVIRRDLDPEAGQRGGPQKYLYPKGFKKTREMFASWFAHESDTNQLVIVEGSVDAAMVWQAGFCAMAQYGSCISPEQVRLIKRMGFTKVVLFYDNDLGGQQALRAARGETVRNRHGRLFTEYDPTTDLRKHFLVSSVSYRSLWPRDPGAMDTVTLATAIVSAKAMR